MTSICFFCSYYTGNSMPEYVRFYLQEVKRHFTKVILVSNEKEMLQDDITFLKSINVDINLVVNEGYDFGMYYKMFKAYNVNEYDRVGLINDSCILFKKLDYIFEWIDKEKPDFCGLIDSNEISYHLQSYFLVINKNSIPLVVDYFNTNGIVKNFFEVIKVYELGLSAYLINAGMSVRSYYSLGSYKFNPTYLVIKEFIKAGFPVIKKKIISREYGQSDWNGLVRVGFDPFPTHYIKLIKKVNGNSYPDNIFSEFMIGYDSWSKFRYRVDYIVVHIQVFWSLMGYYRKRVLIKIMGKNRYESLVKKFYE